MLVQLGVYLFTLQAACMVCHGELVRRKPAPRHLTGFYLWVSAGGAAGGVFTGIVAPSVFPDLWELPLALVAACVLAIWLALGGPQPRRRILRLAIITLASGYVLTLASVLAKHAYDELADNLHVSRGFFGVLRVDQDTDKDGEVRTRLRHGRIIHGLQYENELFAREPTSYYGPGSAVGMAIDMHPRRTATPPLPMKLGFVGLGTGTLACYAVPGDDVRFYEINPDVVALSRGDEPLFTYVRDSAGTVEIAIGDARVSLEREDPQGFDVLALDAFSSDSIPAHLLTVEAIQLYLRHLRDERSVIAVHISNRYLDLDPVVRGLAQELGLAVTRIDDNEDDERVYASDWMLLARDRIAFEHLEAVATVTEAAEHEGAWPVWTDAYSNLVEVLEH
jgi:spermidine synthase